MQHFHHIVAVAAAGGVGTLCRYGIGHLTRDTQFPWGTFIANMLGCFLFGITAELLTTNRLSIEWKAILMTGFLGGFTTFSAFVMENHQYFQSRQWTMLAVHIIVPNILGIVAVIAGIAFVSHLSGTPRI